MDEREQEARAIADGNRVEQLVADPAVKNAIRKLDEKYYQEFKNANDEQTRTAAWAKARALDNLAGELLAVVDNGKLAAHQRNTREMYEKRNGRKS